MSSSCSGAIYPRGAAPRLERRYSSVSGYPEVGQLGRAVIAQQDVVRLDVPVDNASFVGSRQPGQDIAGYSQGFLYRQLSIICPVQAYPEISPGDPFHDQVWPQGRVLPNIDDRHDVWMPESRQQLRLPAYLLHIHVSNEGCKQGVRVGVVTVSQRLQRDVHAGDGVTGPEYGRL